MLVIIDNCSKYGFTVPLKKKNTETITNSIENFLIRPKRKLGLIESDRGKEFYSNIFQDFLNKNYIKIYSGNSSYGAVFAERFNRTIRDLLERPFLKKVMVNGLIYYLKKRKKILIDNILVLI